VGAEKLGKKPEDRNRKDGNYEENMETGVETQVQEGEEKCW